MPKLGTNFPSFNLLKAVSEILKPVPAASMARIKIDIWVFGLCNSQHMPHRQLGSFFILNEPPIYGKRRKSLKCGNYSASFEHTRVLVSPFGLS